MTIQLSPEREAEILRQHRQKQADLQAEQETARKERLKQAQYIQAKVAAAKLNEIHTARKNYVCENCGHTIPEGTEYRRQKIVTGFGWPEGEHRTQRITHLVCALEAKA